MPPFPINLRMDTGPNSPPPSSMVAGPSPLWRLAERRSRKAGSGNIFSNVNLWQVQRLFRAAGDHDAEQRAQLVWGHGDEADLAQALIELRARSQKRGLRTNGRDALGSHWLRAFNHLKIGESSVSSQRRKTTLEDDSEADGSPETGRGSGATVGLSETPGPAETSERPVRSSLGMRRGGESDPDRYLHRILH